MKYKPGVQGGGVRRVVENRVGVTTETLHRLYCGINAHRSAFGIDDSQDDAILFVVVQFDHNRMSAAGYIDELLVAAFQVGAGGNDSWNRRSRGTDAKSPSTETIIVGGSSDMIERDAEVTLDSLAN
jgi:hypothetical protein